MKVIGIDPAPAKDTVIYDGEKFMTKDAVALKKYLDDEVGEDTLICWDAPLTGMASKDAVCKFEGYLKKWAESKKKKKPKWSPLEARILEKYIVLRSDIPKGISTNSFSQCPHWTISQYCLGLPLINDEFKPPETLKTFKLITSQNEREKLFSNKKNIVEVHPALALYLWLKEEKPIKDDLTFDWDYKKNKKTFNTLVEQLFKKPEKPQAIIEPEDKENGKYKVSAIEDKVEKTMTDDHLDAYIAWLLGTLWLKNEVILVGNKNTGAILLPNDPDISEKCRIKLDKYK